MTSLNKIGIADCILGLEKKHFSISELVQDHIKQIKKFKHLNAFVSTIEEDALNKAKKLDADIFNSKDEKKSSLTGIPVAVKDIFCTEGIKTTCCSKMLENFYPSYTATCVEKLDDAILLGKNNMDEFAMGSTTTTGIFGSCINPWSSNILDPLTSGGSSGGSAAAVSAFMCMASLGTDTGGSVRQPASFSGVVGFKPSYGKISRWGVVSFASSLDTVGIFTRSVADSAIMLSHIQGFDDKDSTSKKLVDKDFYSELLESKNCIKKLKVGIIKELNSFTISSDVKKANTNFCKTLNSQGAQIIEISIPQLKEALATYYIISCCEASSNLARYDGMRYGHRTSQEYEDFNDMVSKTRSEGFSDEVKSRILMGTYFLSKSAMSSYYVKAQKLRKTLYTQFLQAFKNVDVIILPTAPTQAFKINDLKQSSKEVYNNDIFTTVANLVGIPSISIPVALSSDNLPLGMQIMGPMYSESLVLKVAHQLEQAINLKISPPGY